MILALFALLLIHPQQTPTAGTDSEGQDHQRLPITPIGIVRVDRDNDFIPDRMGDTVTVAGRASVGTGILHRERLQVFLQDNSGGIELFGRQFMDPIEVGDSVIATGIVGQYNGLTQLNTLHYKIVETTPSAPGSVDLTISETHSERYEGMLVRVQGRIVNKRMNRGGQYILLTQPEESDEILAIFVRDFHRPRVDFDDYSVGDEVRVTGTLGQYDFDPPYREYYQIYPRDPGDIEAVGITRSAYYRIGAVVILLFLASLTWVLALRIQVKNRTKQLREANEKLHRLSGHLMEAQEEERRRISRDLHDNLGQSLTSICIDLERAKNASGVRQRKTLIGRALQGAQQGLTRIRALAYVLRPSLIDDLGLREAIESYISEFELATDIKVKVSFQFENHEIPSVISTNVYRVLQEALNNVYKHAEAPRVTVQIRTEGDKLLLKVQDRGKGFDPDSSRTNNTLGIIGMKERAQLLGGTLTVVSSRGRGTDISLTVPLKQSSEIR